MHIIIEKDALCLRLGVEGGRGLFKFGSLFVDSVLSTPGAVLFYFQLVWSVGTVSLRDVVEVITLRTN